MVRRLAVLALAVMALMGCSPDEQKENAKAAVLRKTGYAKDSKFRSLDKITFDKTTIVCGQVEKKGRNGAESEYVKFFYDASMHNVVMAEDPMTKQMVMAWCVGLKNASTMEPLAKLLGPQKK